MKNFETVAPKLVREMREQGGTITRAVRQYLTLMATKRTRTVLASLSELDFDQEVSAFAAWVEDSFTHGMMSDQIAGLWFNVPEIMMNEPKIYFVGSNEFSLEDADWASATDWTQDETGRAGRATPNEHPAEFDSRVLRDVLQAIGCSDESEESPFEDDEQLGDEMFFTTTGLSQVYLGCLLHLALPKIAATRMLGGRAWRGVGYGLASGDLQYAGVLNGDGWLDKSRAKRMTSKEPDGEFYRVLSNWRWRVERLDDGAWDDCPDKLLYESIRGRRYPLNGPLPPIPPVQTLRMRSNSARATADWCDPLFLPPVVTGKLRRLLETFTRQITWYPVELTHSGKPVEGEFWAMAIRPALTFHDEAASYCPDSSGPLIGICVDPAKLPQDVNVFTHYESPHQIYVRGRVLKEIRRQKIKGVDASKLRVTQM